MGALRVPAVGEVFQSGVIICTPGLRSMMEEEGTYCAWFEVT